MRRIAQSKDHTRLDRFHAFLEQQGLHGIIIEAAEGWGLWVDDENHVRKARDLYAEYELEPDAERYVSAQVVRDQRRLAREQAAAREQQDEVVDQRERRRFSLRNLRGAPSFPVRRGFTLGLIALSLFGALIIDFNLTSPAGQWMSFCLSPTTTTGWATLQDILRGECWRLISPSFVYFDLRHLVFGVIFIYHFGIRIESLRGPIVLGALCVGAAMFTNFAQAVAPVNVAIPGLAGGAAFGGMSAVVFALFGFIWIQSSRFTSDLLRVDSITILVMLVWQTICIASPEWGFANVGHMAGLSFGALVGWLYTPKHTIVLANASQPADTATGDR